MDAFTLRYREDGWLVVVVELRKFVHFREIPDPDIPNSPKKTKVEEEEEGVLVVTSYKLIIC
ncbi:hypothetical protein ACSBR2_021443 [Camellia fascicularis]